jgi:hypothetical protein
MSSEAFNKALILMHNFITHKGYMMDISKDNNQLTLWEERFYG